jgi:beta-lactamase class A
MIAYYELAETNPEILNHQITYEGGADLNQSQDIKLLYAIVPGGTYSVEQLIEYMIKYSDNNATELLYKNIDIQTLLNVYSDFGIPVNKDATISNLDFINPEQVSVMFRVLRNATYLSRDYSEQALELLAQSSFTQGITAGLPSSTIVAHKLGLVGITQNGTTTEHELHDCGIIYQNTPKDDYLLCVMTRGTGNLMTLENIIATISSVVYRHVENGN